jgi:excinuclease ABC subunit C
MEKPKNLPESAGIYQFKDKTGNILYIGKAKNLKNRLNSYFSNQLLPKTAQMISLATEVTLVVVGSEFEALLLEANLIKKYKPKYNIALKDDKSPLYIGITKDILPRIITFRKPEMDILTLKTYFGPYLTGISTKSILKRIRRVFPFSTHLPTKKICIYRQLGLCDPCPSEIEKENDPDKKRELRKRYLRNVRGVKNLLSGKLGFVENELEKEIKLLSREEKFEEAQSAMKQLESFRWLALKPEFDVTDYLTNPNLVEDLRDEELLDLKHKLSKYFSTLQDLNRIECFDVAHLAGSFPTASMVTFIDGEANNKYYRHFKIYQENKTSDVDSMREVINRRLKHLEDWGRPDLIIIDGGKPQLSKVHDLLEGAKIPFIGLAKQFETIVILKDGKFFETKASGPSLKLLQRIRDEAHRFARRLHHKQVRNSIRV